jgi:transcriptional regulator GlxA family with amidase domain
MRIGIVVYDGFDELDAVAPYEVLQNAVQHGCALEVKLVTLHPEISIRGSHGMTIAPEGTLNEAFDWLIVAGGRWAARGSIGAWGEIERGELPRALAEIYKRGTAIASVCTGTMLLSAAGITRGRPAVTHHVAMETLRAQGAEVVKARVVDDGDLLTAGGVTSGIDLALWFIERHFGTAVATGIAAEMEYTRVGPVWQARAMSEIATAAQLAERGGQRGA